MALAALSPAVAQAGTGAAQGRAVVLRPLSFLKTGDLDFGTLISGPTAGQANVDPLTDLRTITGGVLAAGGSPKAARFVARGQPNQFVTVTRGPLPTLTRTGGGATMAVSALTTSGTVFGTVILRQLDATGTLDLRIGGSLAVGANQTEGDYAGTFDITLTFF